MCQRHPVHPLPCAEALWTAGGAEGEAEYVLQGCHGRNTQPPCTASPIAEEEDYTDTYNKFMSQEEIERLGELEKIFEKGTCCWLCCQRQSQGSVRHLSPQDWMWTHRI